MENNDFIDGVVYLDDSEDTLKIVVARYRDGGGVFEFDLEPWCESLDTQDVFLGPNDSSLSLEELSARYIVPVQLSSEIQAKLSGLYRAPASRNQKTGEIILK